MKSQGIDQMPVVQPLQGGASGEVEVIAVISMGALSKRLLTNPDQVDAPVFPFASTKVCAARGERAVWLEGFVWFRRKGRDCVWRRILVVFCITRSVCIPTLRLNAFLLGMPPPFSLPVFRVGDGPAAAVCGCGADGDAGGGGGRAARLHGPPLRRHGRGHRGRGPRCVRACLRVPGGQEEGACGHRVYFVVCVVYRVPLVW
mmetsp:Transcript_53265/g.141040  ORF Transcript_53265/g.141040 Transcript_53265/m.141040 type:complete len:202 (-) Transcript_53265:109-714(-)